MSRFSRLRSNLAPRDLSRANRGTIWAVANQMISRKLRCRKVVGIVGFLTWEGIMVVGKIVWDIERRMSLGIREVMKNKIWVEGRGRTRFEAGCAWGYWGVLVS